MKTRTKLPRNWQAECFDLSQAVKLTGVSRSAFLRAIAAGELRGTPSHPGENGLTRYIVQRGDLIDWCIRRYRPDRTPRRRRKGVLARLEKIRHIATICTELDEGA